jgi:hypothetical protein
MVSISNSSYRVQGQGTLVARAIPGSQEVLRHASLDLYRSFAAVFRNAHSENCNFDTSRTELASGL